MDVGTLKLSDILSKLGKQGLCKISESPPLEMDKEIKIPHVEAERIANLLKQFSEPSKLRTMLLLYFNDALPVCVISHLLNLDQTLVSHHLRTLMKIGLVDYKRAGKYKLYRLTDSSEKILTAILNLLST